MRQPIRKTILSALFAAACLTACGGEKPEAMLGSAKDYLAKNDFKAALIQIKNALQANPDLAEARFLLGKTLANMGDPVGAEVELQKAKDLKYSGDQVVPLQARVLNAQGKFKKVIDELAKVELATKESRADLLTSVAVAQVATGNIDGARKTVAAALAVQSDFPPALIVDARMQAATGDFPGAIARLDRALATSPSDHDAWKIRGDVLVAQGDAAKAHESYRKAIAVRSDFVLAHAALVSSLMQHAKPEEANDALEAMKKVAPKHPRTLFLMSQVAFQKKDFKTAKAVAQELLSLTPNNPNALQLAGAIEIQSGSLLQAESYLTKAVQLAPDLVAARRLLVTLYMRAGQPAKALSALQPLIGAAEKDANLLALAGEVYLMNGDTNKASRFFSKATALNPKDVPKRTALALTQIANGETAAGFQDLEAISAQDSGTTADMALISAHMRRKEFDKALKAVDMLEKKQAGSPAPHHLRGSILLARQDVPAARKNFEHALQIKPGYYASAAILASLDMADKKPDDAKKRFESVLAADPKSVQALLALADLKLIQGGGADEVSSLLQRAIVAGPGEPGPRVALVSWLLKNKDVAKANTAAQEAVTAIPDQPELLDLLGRTQLTSGDTNQALATYAKMAALQPSSPLPHMRSAEAHFQAKNKESAAQSLRKALAIKSDLAEALRGLVSLSLDAGKTSEAVSLARDTQKKHPKEAIGYLLEGDISASMKSWDEAATAYRQGLKQVQSTELAIKLHSVLLASKVREAEAFEMSWLKAQPKDVAFLMYLGEVATSRKDLVAATKAYKAVVGIQPNNALAWNNLAWAAGQQKDPKALEYAEKAYQLQPNQPPIIDTLAVLLSEKGNFSRALELMKKALEIAPQASEIRLNYAKVLIKAGNKLDARKELDELEKLGAKFPGQGEVARLKGSI